MSYTYKKHPKYNYIHMVIVPFDDIEKIDCALCNQPTETPDHYYKRQTRKPEIIVNGGFFDMSNGQTCNSFKDEYITYSADGLEGLGITGDKDLSISLCSANMAARDFISGYPVLIKNGQKFATTVGSEVNYKARRTAVGWNKDNLIVLCVDAPGVKFDVLQNIFLDEGCIGAINLDGGGSTRLLLDGQVKTNQTYARPVDNVFCVYLKQPKKYLYRVQVGAFSKRDNAEKLQAKLISEGFNDAFIVLAGGYYKVQLGAFSVKLNAERMLDRVEALGYDAFVTKQEI